MSDLEIIGLGALNTDHIYIVERIIDDGESVVKEAVSFPGGSAANTIYGLARLGTSTGFIGAVGNDTEGEVLLQDLRSVDVDTSQIKVIPSTITGSVICLSDGSGKRSLYVQPGANSQLTMVDIDLDYVNQAKILHLSSFADYFEIKLDGLAPSLRLSFAPGAVYAAKGLEILSPILSRTYVLFLNRDEITQLTGQDIIDGAETCINHGCQIVVVTLGRGIKLGSDREAVDSICYIRDSANQYYIHVPESESMSAIETIGAGDAFAAGFLYGLLNDKALDECGRLGDIVARLSITRTGARQGLPTLNQLAQRYQGLYHREL